jgi:predicted RecA/RadA family phage recombinase
MATNYIAEGSVIDVVAGATTTAGSVVKVNKILGVAIADIANGATGPVQIVGVFSCPKLSGAVIAAGESLTWDVSAGNFDDQAATPATGDVTGAAAVAVEAAGNGVTTVKVRFTGVPGTVT